MHPGRKGNVNAAVPELRHELNKRLMVFDVGRLLIAPDRSRVFQEVRRHVKHLHASTVPVARDQMRKDFDADGVAVAFL